MWLTGRTLSARVGRFFHVIAREPHSVRRIPLVLLPLVFQKFSCKLLMLGLCLATGWRGGIFFPVFLIACATGTALHQLIPDLGSLGSWCGAITGAMYRYLLPGPLVVLVLGLALLQGHGAAGLLVGLAIAHWFRLGPGADGGPPPPPETPDSRGYPQPRS